MAAPWQKSIGLKNGGNQGFRFVSLFLASFPFSESTLSVTERLRLTLGLLEEKDPNCSRRIWREKMGGDLKSVPKICRKSQQQCSSLFKTRELSVDNYYTEFTTSKPFVLKQFIYDNIHSGVGLERNEITNKTTFFEIKIICLKYYDWLSSAVKLCK